MGSYQTFRGNPENKLFYLLHNFMGGINTEFSDDSSNDVDFENIINFDMDKLGTLNKRGGFGELIAISEIFNKLDPDTELPNIKNRTEDIPNPENLNDNIVYMKLLRDDNKCFRALSGFSGENAYRKYQEMYGFQQNRFTLLLITTRISNNVSISNTSTAWFYQCYLPELEYEDGEPTDTETMTITCNKTVLPVTFNWDRNLMNLETIEFYDKIHFTGNNRCLVTFDRTANITSDTTLKNAFTYSGWSSQLDNVTNNAHVPTGLEIRHIGFNVLCDDPMHAIDTQGLSVDTIQGIFLCTTDNKPVLDIPLGSKFVLNIMYTGTTYNNFKIEMKEGDKELTFTSTVNSTLSRDGFKAYDITFKDVPSGEVEIKITKLDNEAEPQPLEGLEPFYDYVNVKQVDKETKTVTQLNIGDYGICEMYNRAVYYKDDTIWFSDVNNFNYVPHYNWVSLPIEPTDKITKICYFKKSYIIFTKQRIYKMTGSFGQSDFAVSPVNMSLGCHAGNTVVPIEDTLYFSSPRGLYALKSSQFVEGFENVKELDLKVKKLTSDFTKYSDELASPAVRFNGVSERAYAVRYKDKYLLFYNNYNDKGDYAAVNDLDVLTYQFDIGAYTTYRFKEKPTFLFMVDNAIETFSTVKQKEEYIEAEPIFHYSYNAIENGVATDLTGNHNDATLKGNLALNEGNGVTLNAAGGYVDIDEFNGEDISNELNIELDIEVKDIRPGVDGGTLLALQQSDFNIPDKNAKVQKSTSSTSFTINEPNGGSNTGTIIVEYDITPNPATLTDDVSYTIYLQTLKKPLMGYACSLNYKIEPIFSTLKTYTTTMSISTSKRKIGSGNFTINRNSNGTYSASWTLNATLTLTTGLTTTVTTTVTRSLITRVDLQRAIGCKNEFIIRYTSDDKIGLRVSTTKSAGGTGYSEFFPDNSIGVSGRHKWTFSLKTVDDNVTYTLKKDDISIYTYQFTNSYGMFEVLDGKRDLCYIGGRLKDGAWGGTQREKDLYKLKISNSSKTLLEYNFNEGTGTEIYDIVNRTKATLHNSTWMIDYGLKFKGDGYLELPALRDIYFSNGFELEFNGKLGGNSELARLIDLATAYNNDNMADKNCSISVGVKDNTISLNSTSKTFRTYKIQTSEIDLTQLHTYLLKCIDNGSGYTMSITVDNTLITQADFTYGGIDNITRLSNFIGKSNTTTEAGLKAILMYIKLKTYASSSLVPIYRTAVYEFDTTSTDFEKPIYIELKTKGINMKYPQHLKKLKHIFVKAIGGYKYGELLFTLFGDGYIVNDPKKYSYYINEEGQVVQDYEDVKDLKIDERVSLLGNMRLDKTKLGEGIYQIRKLIIPKKCKNFTLLISGDSDDYISFESFGFVVKLGKVKEG